MVNLGPVAAARKAKFLADDPEFLVEINEDLVDAYCLAYERWQAMEAWLAEPGHAAIATIHDDKGNIKSHGPSPQFLIAEKACKEMSRLGKALGLND